MKEEKITAELIIAKLIDAKAINGEEALVLIKAIKENETKVIVPIQTPEFHFEKYYPQPIYTPYCSIVSSASTELPNSSIVK